MSHIQKPSKAALPSGGGNLKSQLKSEDIPAALSSFSHKSAIYWPISTKFCTKPHRAMEHNYQKCCGNRTAFGQDMQDCLFCTQCAGIYSFLF